MIFARIMHEFYLMIARKIFSRMLPPVSYASGWRCDRKNTRPHFLGHLVDVNALFMV